MNSLVRQNAITADKLANVFVDYLHDEWYGFINMINIRPCVSDAVVAKKLTFLLEHAHRIKSMDDEMLNHMKGLLTTVTRDINNAQ